MDGEVHPGRAADLFAAATAHFETLWNDAEFQHFDPDNEEHCQRLRVALGGAAPAAAPTWWRYPPGLTCARVPFKKLCWSALPVNGAMAAAAICWLLPPELARRWLLHLTICARCSSGARRPFAVCRARVEILRQAMATFRQILRRPDFGELLADGCEPWAFSTCLRALPAWICAS